MLENRLVQFVDTTLRDGEQSPGVVFNTAEKARIAKALVSLGVYHIEAGTPAISAQEREAVKEIVSQDLPASIYTWNRSRVEDIQASLECGIQNLFVSSPVSDILIKNKLKKSRHGAFYMLAESIEYAHRNGAQVVAGLEDFFRADQTYALEVIRNLEKLGVGRVRISDTTGVAKPSDVTNAVSAIKQYSEISIEFHGHNDFGLAVANSLAAFQAGADYIDTTLLGIGERAGNAALEEVSLAMDQLYKAPTGIKFSELCHTLELMQEIIGYEAWPWKPMAGKKIFQYESGVHADGMLKKGDLYQPYDPRLCERKNEIVIGKHSGRKSLNNVLSNYGIAIENNELRELLTYIKELSTKMKRAFSENEIIDIYNNYQIKAAKDTVDMVKADRIIK